MFRDGIEPQHPPRQPFGFQQLPDGPGLVLWLNPIPEHKWPYIKSCQAFLNVCSMVSCATLQSLAHACRKLADS